MTKLNKEARAFLAEQEAVSAAKSKAAKKAKRTKHAQWFRDWMAEKAEKIEANGNPAGAEAFRAYWSRILKHPIGKLAGEP